MIKTENLKSSNFWMNLALLAGAIFVGLGGIDFPTQELKAMVSAVFAIFAGASLLRNWFKNAELKGKLKDLLKNSNVWAALLTVLVGLVPALPVEALQDLADAILEGNLQAILIAAFNLLNILYHLFLKPKMQKNFA